MLYRYYYYSRRRKSALHAQLIKNVMQQETACVLHSSCRSAAYSSPLGEREKRPHMSIMVKLFWGALSQTIQPRPESISQESLASHMYGMFHFHPDPDIEKRSEMCLIRCGTLILDAVWREVACTLPVTRAASSGFQEATTIEPRRHAGYSLSRGREAKIAE